MKSKEKLYLAIGQIDEKLIEEATTPVSKAPFVIKKIITIAASIFVVNTVVIISLGMMMISGLGGKHNGSPNNPDYNYSEPNGSEAPNNGNNNESVPPDNIIKSEIGKLVILDRNKNEFYLVLDIFIPTDTPLHINCYDDAGNIISSTDPSMNSKNSPVIIVDGMTADSLPCEVGKYQVKIIFPELTDDNNNNGSPPDTNESKPKYFTIDNFGTICFDDVD